MKKLAILIVSALGIAACSSSGYFDTADADVAATMSERGGGDGNGGQAGVVTAAEWNDLDNWPFWGSLMTKQGDEQTEGYAAYSSRWGFHTDRRVAVLVKSADGTPVPGAKVSLDSGGKSIWTSVTDVLGRADCWIGMHDASYQSGTLSISINGAQMDGTPSVTGWGDEAVKMNEYSVSASTAEASADILFIVDATGSMGDELEFLKADLLDILNRAGQLQTKVAIRTGALFYRDEGDEYVTKVSKFSDKYSTTIDFIKKQRADGGADWPEAVHTALEKSLQEFDWNSSARARIAFIILDAPPHENEKGVMESIHKSIDRYAAMGIKLIPIAASGIDKACEFLLRMMAVATNGTYVFITNDSGVGNEHLEATVGEYQVELLNDLMVRLIQKYLE